MRGVIYRKLTGLMCVLTDLMIPEKCRDAPFLYINWTGVQINSVIAFGSGRSLWLNFH